MASALPERVHDLLTAEDDGQVCRDLPEGACDERKGNFGKHVAALTLTKSGDALIDPKLVLSWLLTGFGAPVWMIGVLVPIREAGALLPQLFTAGWVRSRPRRKWVWVTGSAAEGAAVLALALSALTLRGAAFGWAALSALAVFALARSLASVSYKDVLGKTVSKATRGTATGAASTAAAGTALLFGVVLLLPGEDGRTALVTGGLFVAALLWLLAAAVFASLHETPGHTDGGRDQIRLFVQQFGWLRSDPQLSLFIVVRALLMSTALAPPYMLAAAGLNRDEGAGSVGWFVLASAAAGLVSSYVWGRLADRSSRRTLAASGAVGAAFLGASAAVAGFGLDAALAQAALLFGLMIAYQGVRVGRSTHIVDMADAERRAGYTALSNTIIGVLLLAASAFGALAALAGTWAVLAVFALMALAAGGLALRLEEVQRAEA